VREDQTTSETISDGTFDNCTTITTSTAASCCCPKSSSIDYDSDFYSINSLNCVVTITGSCYELGFKNDSYQWDDCFLFHRNNLNELSNSPDNFRTRIVNVGDYASHIFMGVHSLVRKHTTAKMN
jgi:hypothetical protein